ncbi:MAG: divalent cation tolerance protein CutA [bacterium]|nr:divalent cation tolerance protein CutA [bacterium]
MSIQYLQVSISAENKTQADKILNALLSKKLVTGGQIINAPARFLWKGEIVDMNYHTIMSFTAEKHKEAIILVVKENSIEEVPMISFVKIEGNTELLKWIEETVS